jgi:hypothetical protein
MLIDVITVRVLPKRPGHTLGGFARHFRGNVAISVHGQSNLAMAGNLHDNPGGDALSK